MGHFDSGNPGQRLLLLCAEPGESIRLLLSVLLCGGELFSSASSLSNSQQCTAISPSDAPYTACCTPLPAGTAVPQTCMEMSSSNAMQGTTCQFGAVPTTDFPQDYNYAPTSTASSPPQTSSGMSAESTQSTQSEGGCATVWVTQTITTTCAATPTSQPSPSATPAPPPTPPPSNSAAPPASSSSASDSVPSPCACPDGSTGYGDPTQSGLNGHGSSCVCGTSSGMLSEPTSSEAPPPPPASTSEMQTSSQTPPPPPPASSEPQSTTSTSTSWSPSPSLTNIAPPCASSDGGLITDSYVPSCTGDGCGHVG